MNKRQLKKIENIYLTKRDVVANTKRMTKEQIRIEKEIIGKEQEILLRQPFNNEKMFDDILDKFIHNNLDKLTIEDEYFNKLFLDSVKKFSPKEFLEFDSKLNSIDNPTDFYNTLISETSFKIDFFKDFDMSRFNNVEIKTILNFDNYLVLDSDEKDRQLKEILEFDLNWFKNPFYVLTNYKIGNTKENIKNVVTYLNFYFDTPIEYEKNLIPFIYVPYNAMSKGKKRNKKKKSPRKKVMTTNYEERLNKKYLFSSVNNSFYKFLFKNTKGIVLDEDNIRFLLDNEYINELIICK